MAAGDAVLTWAFHEQNPLLVPEAVQCQAVADGDDFVINGTKMFVDNYRRCRSLPGGVPHCSGVRRQCRPDVVPGGHQKRGPVAASPLVSLAKDKMSEVTFENVRVPKGNMIGALHQGWPLAELMLEQATALLCAQMLGATRKDAEMAIEWSKYRKAFGQPIGAFQSIQHMCADMLMWIDGGNLLTYEALWKMDQGLPAGVEASQAKAFCNEKCEASVRICQGIHGGIGFMMEFDLQLWYRRVCAWTMRLGTAYEHRAKVARALLDQPGHVILGRPVPVVAEA